MAPHVRLYTKRWCVYCVAAARLLNRKGVVYEKIDLTGDAEGRRELAAVTGRRTVPQIFIGARSIGGLAELRALDGGGALDALLAEHDRVVDP